MTEHQDAAWDIPDVESLDGTNETNSMKSESTSKGRRTKKAGRAKGSTESKTSKSNDVKDSDGNKSGEVVDESDQVDGKSDAVEKKSRRKTTRRKTKAVKDTANMDDADVSGDSAVKSADIDDGSVASGEDEVVSVKKPIKKKTGRKSIDKTSRESERQDRRGKRAECKKESSTCGRESVLDDMAVNGKPSSSDGLSAFDAIFSAEPVTTDSGEDAVVDTNESESVNGVETLDGAALVSMTSDERRKTENVEVASILNETLDEALAGSSSVGELENTSGEDVSDSSEDSAAGIGWNLDDSESDEGGSEEEWVGKLGFSEEESSSEGSTEETTDSDSSADALEVDGASVVETAIDGDSSSDAEDDEVSDDEDILSLGWNPPVHQILPRKSFAGRETVERGAAVPGTPVSKGDVKADTLADVAKSDSDVRSVRKDRKPSRDRSEEREVRTSRDGRDRGRDKGGKGKKRPESFEDRRATNDRAATKSVDQGVASKAPWDLSNLDEESEAPRSRRKGEASMQGPSVSHAENILSDLFELTPTVDSVFGSSVPKEDASKEQESSSAILDGNFESVESDDSDMSDGASSMESDHVDVMESSDTELPIPKSVRPGAVRAKNASQGSRTADGWGALVADLGVETNGDEDEIDVPPRSDRRRDRDSRDARPATEDRSDRRRDRGSRDAKPATEDRGFGPNNGDEDTPKAEHGIIPTWMDAISWLVRGNIDHRNDRGQGDHRRGGKR